MTQPDDETLPTRPPSTLDGPEFAETVQLSEEESTASPQTAETVELGQKESTANPQTAETISQAPGAEIAETVDLGEEGDAKQDTQPTSGGKQPRGKIGPYELIEELARGGMGVVYRAKHSALGHEVALKVLLAGEDASEAELARFLREARAAARLEHPGVVRIHDMGQHRGTSYLAMDLIRGESLAAKIKTGGPLPAREAAAITRDVADALHFAHTHSILHRDLKPGNVLLSTDGRALLTDFGLAKDLTTDDDHTRTGQILGTPVYMPPELAEGHHDEVDPRSDVYSLGATLYEMLTGEPPFSGTSLMLVLRDVIKTPPRPPSTLRPGIDPDLETICLKCLDKEREGRYPTAQALADDLGRYLEHRSIAARRPTPLQRAQKWTRRNRQLAGALLAMATAALVLLLASGALFVWRVTEARQEAVKRGVEAELALGELEVASRATAAALERSRQQADMARRVLDVLLFDVRRAARESKDERLVKLLEELEPGEFGQDGLSAAGLAEQQLKFARTLVRISEVQADPASDVRALSHAVELFPPGAERADALALLALAHHAHENLPAAVKTLERAEALATEESEALRQARAAIRPLREKVVADQEQKHDATSVMQAVAAGDREATQKLLANLLAKPSLLRGYRQKLEAELAQLESTRKLVEEQGGQLSEPDQKRKAELELLLEDEGALLTFMTKALAKSLVKSPTSAHQLPSPATETLPGWLGQVLKGLHDHDTLEDLLGVRHYRGLERGSPYEARYPELWTVDLRIEPTRPEPTLVLDLEVRALAGFESRLRIVHRYRLGFGYRESSIYLRKGEFSGRVQGTQLVYSTPQKGKVDSKPWTAQHTFKTVALFLLPRVLAVSQPERPLRGSFVLDPEFDDYALGWKLEPDPQGWKFTNSEGELRWHLQRSGRIEQHGSGPGVTPKTWVPLSAEAAAKALASADVLPRDKAKLETKAKTGHREAMYEFALRLRNHGPGEDEPQDDHDARIAGFLRRAAAKDHPQACYELGQQLSALTFAEVRGTSDMDEARIQEGFTLLEQGARLGVAECLQVLGQRHDPTREPRDPSARPVLDRASSLTLHRSPLRQRWRTEERARQYYARAYAAGVTSAHRDVADMLTKLAAHERLATKPTTEAAAKTILARLAEALQFDPTNQSALQLRSTLWVAIGEPQRAIVDLDAALAAHTEKQRALRFPMRGQNGARLDGISADLLTRRARAHEAAAAYPQALADLTRCVEANTRGARLERARYHVRRGEPKLALSDLDARLARRSSDVTARHLRSKLRLAAGDLQGAAEDMSLAFRASPRAQWGLDAGFLNAGAGRWDAAKTAFAATATQFPFAAIGARALGAETPALAKLTAGKDAWAKTLVALVSGEVPLVEALKIAGAGPKPAEKRCEAYGYAGLAAEASGDVAAAKAHYTACLKTGVKEFYEYSLAQRRLQALGD